MTRCFVHLLATSAVRSRGVRRHTPLYKTACLRRTAPKCSACPLLERCTALLQTMSCRAVSSSLVLGTSRWHARQGPRERRCAVYSSCSRWRSRWPIWSSSARSPTDASMCAVARAVACCRTQSCTARARSMSRVAGSASIKPPRVADLALSARAWRRSTTALTQSVCSTVQAIARSCRHGVVQAPRWHGCGHARRGRARRCIQPTLMTRCVQGQSSRLVHGTAAKRAYPLQWTMRFCKERPAICGRCAASVWSPVCVCVCAHRHR